MKKKILFTAVISFMLTLLFSVAVAASSVGDDAINIPRYIDDTTHSRVIAGTYFPGEKVAYRYTADGPTTITLISTFQGLHFRIENELTSALLLDSSVPQTGVRPCYRGLFSTVRVGGAELRSAFIQKVNDENFRLPTGQTYIVTVYAPDGQQPDMGVPFYIAVGDSLRGPVGISTNVMSQARISATPTFTNYTFSGPLNVGSPNTAVATRVEWTSGGTYTSYEWSMSNSSQRYQGGPYVNTSRVTDINGTGIQGSWLITARVNYTKRPTSTYTPKLYFYYDSELAD